MSRPLLIGARLWQSVLSPALWVHMGVTVTETVLGFLIGAATGILAGFALARWRRAHVALEPYLMGIYSLPRVALAPLFIMWFGIGIPSKMMLAISIVFFILLINTYVGVQNVDQDLVNAVKTMGAPPRFITRRVVLPSCVPWIFSGLRISVALALTAAVVGEMLAAQYGLGFAQKVFPNLDVAIMKSIIAIDSRTYFGEITEEMMRAVNQFQKQMGVVKTDFPYDKIVAAQLKPLWTAP